MTKWEYMQAGWQQSTVLVSGRPQTWETQYWVKRAGTDFEYLAADLDWLAFLNELGTDGWEMINERIPNSVVLGNYLGWPNASSPVSMVWTFKRPRA